MYAFTPLLLVWKGSPGDEDSSVKARSLFFLFLSPSIRMQSSTSSGFIATAAPLLGRGRDDKMIMTSWKILIPVNIWQCVRFIWPSMSQARLDLTYGQMSGCFFLCFGKTSGRAGGCCFSHLSGFVLLGFTEDEDYNDSAHGLLWKLGTRLQSALLLCLTHYIVFLS